MDVMDMTLTPEIQAMVQHHLAGGAYRSPQSVLMKAFYALQEVEAMCKTNAKNAASQLTEKARKQAPPVLDIFCEAWAEIPEEEFEAMPEDGAEQVDHYLYGTPKL